jgi:hypothetical protein
MTIDLRNFTIADQAETVPVAEFRNRIEHLHALVSCDYHSAVGENERARWCDSARLIGAELIATTCKRATLRDWEARERAIDRSAVMLGKHGSKRKTFAVGDRIKANGYPGTVFDVLDNGMIEVLLPHGIVCMDTEDVTDVSFSNQENV